jgi:hypothetical protein
MWRLAKERHKHRQILCQWQQHNCSPCRECDTRGALMVRIHYRILGAKSTRYVWNVTCCLGDGKLGIVRQRVQGSVRAVSAVWNTQVFLTATRVVADVDLVN